MGVLASTSEIVESIQEDDDDDDLGSRVDATRAEKKKHSIEDDINRLFQAIEVRNSARNSGLSRDRLQKSAMKRPMRAGMSPSSGIGISEPVSLKQALRGLCISQASEMAVMKRMMSKPAGSSGVSEAGNIKRLYRAVVVEANSSGLLPISQGKGNFMEISLVPDMPDLPEKTPESLPVPVHDENSVVVDEVASALTVVPISSPIMEIGQNDKLCSGSGSGKMSKSFIFRNKNRVDDRKVDTELNHDREGNEKALPAPLRALRKGDSESSASREKEKFSQSSKSSCTSSSEERSASGSSRGAKRPHMSRDSRWQAVHSIIRQHGSLGLDHFKLLRRLGCGDIGTVYLAELTGTNCLFALKVMDNEFLAARKKIPRAQTEREILQMLDHPFLPTLFAHFVSDKFSCLVMEYCPGGDLHVLRQKQPGRCFSEQAARFYVAEVLLALEYLHMLGVVYRDLKPENILVREDGHIMLSDFDLSLRGADVNPTVLKSPSSPSPASDEPTKKTSSPCAESSCIDPFCLQPSWQVSCFAPAKPRKMKPEPAEAQQVSPLPQLVAEPTGALSNSFVGTHEYLAPEIVKGEGHGSAVDWWTLGIFLFELLYGRTPFKGSSGNEDTLANVVSKSLKFPNSPMVSFHARDLIRGLLAKDHESRLGSVRGAAEIKRHPFFEGLNWALIRCTVPPELPKFSNSAAGASSSSSLKQETTTQRKELSEVASEHTEFEVF